MTRLDAFDVAVVIAWLAALLALLAGCSPALPCGRAAATRCGFCEGASVRETCGADGRWRITLHCGQVSQWTKAPYVCGPAPGGGVTCLPRSP